MLAEISIRVYSWIGGDRPIDVGLAAKEAVENGFTAVKMNATEELQYIDSYEKIDAAVERIAAVREAVGDHLELGLIFMAEYINQWQKFSQKN